MSMQSADRPTSTVTDVLSDLVRSRVLDVDRARSLLAELPSELAANPVALLGILVENGVLTRFQSEKLLRGQWQNLILGPYVVLGPLGRGGMGFVYLARNRSGGELLALKVLPPARARERPRALPRFRREIEIGQRLPVHPNLTRMLDAGESGGAHYLAMEYVPGKTVRQIVSETGPLSIELAARVFADVASGLQAAHAAGFVHRDLKPANIIVTPIGRAKLLDFGFALVRGEVTPSDPTFLGGPGYTLGTMDYLPPEQAVDPIGVGPSADLYALGCSLYYTLSGCPPFPGGSVRDKLRWHRNDPPPQLDQLNPAVPTAFVELIAQLMAKRVEDRPTSAAQVAEVLNQWAEPIQPAVVEQEGTRLAEELFRQVDAVWEASLESRNGSRENVPVDNSEITSKVNSQQRLPLWFVSVGFVVLSGILVLAAVLGWLAARLLNG